ncbi:MAG: hypothetical protein AB1567_11860, partial [bacterium]
MNIYGYRRFLAFYLNLFHRSKYFEKQKRCIKDSDLIISGIHGDFAPVNIIIDGDRIICSDFN